MQTRSVRVARLLKPLGIGPDNVGPDSSRARGYNREQFRDAFERYLAPEGASEVHRCTKRDEIRVPRVSDHSQNDGCAVGNRPITTGFWADVQLRAERRF
jgi:hypothetical protein